MSERELPRLTAALETIQAAIDLCRLSGDFDAAQAINIRLALAHRNLHEVLAELEAAPAAPAASAPADGGGTLASGAPSGGRRRARPRCRAAGHRPLGEDGNGRRNPHREPPITSRIGTGAGPSSVEHLLLGGNSGLFFAFFDMDRRWPNQRAVRL